MKFVLCNYKNKPYVEIKNECLSYKGGSHGYIIDNIVHSLLFKINDRAKVRDIHNKIKQLKVLRTNSDYFNIQILNDEASKSISYSEEIINTIKIYLTK